MESLPKAAVDQNEERKGNLVLHTCPYLYTLPQTHQMCDNLGCLLNEVMWVGLNELPQL